MARRPVIDRLLEKCAEDENGCWIFSGALHVGLYGKISVEPGKWVGAHRVTYEFFIADIPPGMHVDHLCRVTRCVNPYHLEAVPPGINTKRSTANARSAEVRRARTHCKNGHPFDRIKTDGARGCRTCQRAWTRAYKARQKHKLSREDAASLRSEVEARMKELTAPVGAS